MKNPITQLRLFYNKLSISARINIPSEYDDVILGENFLPRGMIVRKWVSRSDWQNDVSSKGHKKNTSRFNGRLTDPSDQTSAFRARDDTYKHSRYTDDEVSSNRHRYDYSHSDRQSDFRHDYGYGTHSRHQDNEADTWYDRQQDY